MKKIIILIVIVAVIIFGYFAYKSIRGSTDDLSADSLKSMIENKANQVNDQVNQAADDGLQDLRNDASDAIKSKVDQTLGTKK